MVSSPEVELKLEPPFAEAPWPIAELELELSRGSLADRFALPRPDCGKAPRTTDVPAFVDGDQPASFKAAPIVLQPDMPTAETFRVIMRACVQHFRLNEPLLIANRSAESLHQARVAIRRLRSALSLFRSMAEDQEYERLKRRLCDVSHQFGKARNLDVYVARATASSIGGKAELLPLELIHATRVQGARARAYQRVVCMLRSKGFCELMQDLVAWMERDPGRAGADPERQAVRDQPIEDFAAQVLERRRRKLRQSGRHLDRLSPDGRHRIRIEAKKLRYAAEFFSSLSADGKHRARYTSFITALEQLQSSLGHLNDIETGNEIAAEVAGPEPVAASGSCGVGGTRNHLDEQERRTAALVRSAGKAHRRLSAVKPFWKSA
jgi:triphosphatase